MKEKVIALGFFDGVHLGHAALLRRTVEEAARRGVTPAVFTFDRPPKEVLTGTPCPLINSPEDRKDLVQRLFGIREVLMVPFDHEMMTTPWDDFVTNVGTRPTVNSGSDITVEACLLDFEGDLYGRTLRVEFFQHLRDEIRFDSLDALKAQIAADADTTRAYFQNLA